LRPAPGSRRYDCPAGLDFTGINGFTSAQKLSLTRVGALRALGEFLRATIGNFLFWDKEMVAEAAIFRAERVQTPAVTAEVSKPKE
jgi:hypothetical protein